ncbi:hypothetical protein FOZ61_007991 [Perkinsus olseni]|uniref:Cyclin-like domain-containing protein n=1 Tax=Perkinsus olseni TaxID=32597 RepID=A0A7J6L6P8_PEROL|nr:hypothetical protein FOZ61_007991 [Perkinsus olseni]
MPVMSVLEINSPLTAYFPAFLSILIITIIVELWWSAVNTDDASCRPSKWLSMNLAKKHPSDREAVLNLLVAAATAETSTRRAEDANLTAGLDGRPVGEVIGKHKVDESPSSPVCTSPHRAVRGFIIDMLVASMMTDDDAVFGQTEIMSKLRSAAASEGLEGIDDVPWWLSLYVHDLGSARRMNSERKMIFESEISELVARHPCRSLCRPVITEVLSDISPVDVGLRPAIRRCLTVLPIDTLRVLLSYSTDGRDYWLIQDIISTVVQVPLTDYHTFADIISIIISAVGIPVDQALMLVLERLLRIVSSSGTRYDDAQVPGLIRILANIRQNGGANVMAETSLVLEVVVAICLWEMGDDLSCHTAEVANAVHSVCAWITAQPTHRSLPAMSSSLMLIECCPVVYLDDPPRDLLVAAVMALQDDRLSTGLDKKLSSQAREVASVQQREQHDDHGLDVGCLPLATMWLEWSKATMHANITNEDMPPLALATLLYRLASAPEVVDEHLAVCLVSGRGFSLRLLPHLARLIPKLSPKGSEMLAYALAAHLESHKEISKHAAVKPMVYRTMTTLFPLPLAAAAVARHLLRIIPDVYIDKMLGKLERDDASMEESYLQLLEAYTAEYPARVAGTHLDRVQQLLALERSDHARSRGLLMIRRLCMVLELAVDVPGWSGVEFIWEDIYEGSSSSSFNRHAWDALARVVRSRGKQFIIDGPPDQAGPLLAAFTPTTVVQLANDVIDNQLPEGKEDRAALASCLAAFADINVSDIGRSAFVASSAAAEGTTSNDISPLGRRLHGFLRTASRRSPLAQLAISKGPGGATLPVLRRLLSTVRVLPSGVFGGGYMLAMNWKKFMNRLVKSGDAKPVEIFDTLMDALPTDPGNALLALSALGRCRAMQFSMKARDAIEGVLYTKADILDSLRSLAVIALALLLGSLPYAQATATAEGLFASLDGSSSAGRDSTITTRLWMMPYWCLINRDKVEEVISRLIVGCKADPATATACGYGLALLVTLHWGRPEVLQSLASRLKDTPPTSADLCARVLCGLDVGSHCEFKGELGMIAAGLAGVPPDRIDGYGRSDPELRVLYLGALYACPGTLPAISQDNFTAPRNSSSDNPLAVVDKLEKYDSECTIGVAVQLMHSAESITWASANRKRREINNLSYVKEGTALQLIMQGSQAATSSLRHEISLAAAASLSEPLPRKCMRILLGGAQRLSPTSELKIRLLSYFGEVGLSELFNLYTRASSVPTETQLCLVRSIPSLPMEAMDAPMLSAIICLAEAAAGNEEMCAAFLSAMVTMLTKWRGSSEDSNDCEKLCGEIVESLVKEVPRLFVYPRLWPCCSSLLAGNISETSVEEVKKLNPLLTSRIAKYQPFVRRELLLLLGDCNDAIYRAGNLLKIADNFVCIGSGSVQGSRRSILGLAERFKDKEDDDTGRKICRRLAAAVGLSMAAPRELRLATTSHDVTERIDDILPVCLAREWRPVPCALINNIDQTIDYVGKRLICEDIFPACDDPNIHQLVEGMFSTNYCVSYPTASSYSIIIHSPAKLPLLLLLLLGTTVFHGHRCQSVSSYLRLMFRPANLIGPNGGCADDAKRVRVCLKQPPRDGPRNGSAEYIEIIAANELAADGQGKSLARRTYLDEPLRCLTAAMRATLIEWMIEVHDTMDNTSRQESLFLAVDIVDRYLAAVPGTRSRDLQLVGCAALLIAMKFEDINHPDLRGMVSTCGHGTYSTAELAQMEVNILNTIGYTQRGDILQAAIALGRGCRVVARNVSPPSCLARPSLSCSTLHPSGGRCRACCRQPSSISYPYQVLVEWLRAHHRRATL